MLQTSILYLNEQSFKLVRNNYHSIHLQNTIKVLILLLVLKEISSNVLISIIYQRVNLENTNNQHINKKYNITLN